MPNNLHLAICAGVYDLTSAARAIVVPESRADVHSVAEEICNLVLTDDGAWNERPTQTPKLRNPVSWW